MPSTATITAHYTFSANTKARASQVNVNFNNYRGHIVAIDPNTATSINETYDLGSTEYRWRTGYFRDIDLKSNTTTGQALSIIGDTAAGNGAFNFHIGSTLPGQINSNGFTGNLYGQLNKPVGPTTTASIGQLSRVQISSIFAVFTAGSTILVGTTISIISLGRPVAISLTNDPTTTSAIYRFANTNTSAFGDMLELYLYRSSTIVDFRIFGSDEQTRNSSNPFYLGPISFIDTSAPSGTNTYHLRWRSRVANSSFAIEVSSIYAKEI